MYKTTFTFNGMMLRISKDECGRDRFSEQEIKDAIMNNESEVGGDKSHCLCRKSDGKIYAEIMGS